MFESHDIILDLPDIDLVIEIYQVELLLEITIIEMIEQIIMKMFVPLVKSSVVIHNLFEFQWYTFSFT